MDILNKLKHIDFNNSSPEDIIRILELKPILTILSSVNKGVYILRTRKGGNFTKRSQMTYRPIKMCNSMQRATLAGNTVFYGVISDNQSHLENARVISVCECSSLCRKGKESIGREKFSISYWEVVKPLNVISFIADTTFPGIQNNMLLNYLRKAFAIESKLLPEEDKDVFRFISSEFSKTVNDPKEYLISATIATTILNSEGKKIDGIVYPSVQLGGQAGLNIAISPRAVNKKLRFVRVVDNTLYKNKEQSVIRIEKVIERSSKTKVLRTNITNQELKEMLDIDSLSILPILDETSD